MPSYRWPNLEIDPQSPMARFLKMSSEERSAAAKLANKRRRKDAVHQANGRAGREARKAREAT
jgi:hypothetical protein